MAMANASAVATLVVYVICAAAFALLPDLAMAITQSWFHGLDLSILGRAEVTTTTLITGLVTATSGSWLVGYLFAYLYNLFLKK